MDPVYDISSDEEETIESRPEVWTPSARSILGSPHPTELNETGVTRSVNLPPLTVSLEPFEHLLEDCSLSGAQLEGCAYAIQRHLSFLPNGQRAGFFIGDSTGVGKGRQLAAIILYYCTKNVLRHCWLSVSSELVRDAERDFKGVKFDPLVTDIKHLQDSQVPAVAFSSYSGCLNKEAYAKLVKWLCNGRPATEFEGVIVFDEAHKGKHYKEGDRNSSKTGQMMVKFQNDFPNARVVYASATSASHTMEMQYMTRLGYWGQKCAYECFDDFKKAMALAGVPGMELLAVDMKTKGMAIARSISFAGTSFYSRSATLTPEHAKVYRAACEAWQEVWDVTAGDLSDMADEIDVDMFDDRELEILVGPPKNNPILAAFASAHQRFFAQLLLCFRVETIVEEAKAKLEEGMCVIIGIQSTGEASVSRRGIVAGKLCSVCADVAREYIIAYLKGDRRLLTLFGGLTLPPCALDDIIDRMGGPSVVAEMTGRRSRQVRGKDGAFTVELRDVLSSSLNNHEKDAFMEGEKLVAVISAACSTGISLHADKGAKNQRRRFHATIELPWAADAAIQQLGRSHRSNQTSAPLFCLISTGLGAEKRFVSSVAKRLQEMGALTQGDRRASIGSMAIGDAQFEGKAGLAALKQIVETKYTLIPGVDWEKVVEQAGSIVRLDEVEESSEEDGEFCVPRPITTDDIFLKVIRECLDAMRIDKKSDVKRFLNMLLGLPFSHQAIMFGYFCAVLDIEQKKQEKGFIKFNGATSRSKPAQVIYGEDSPFPVMLENISLDKRVSFEQALEQVLEGAVFYKRRHMNCSEKQWILCATDERLPSGSQVVIRPYDPKCAMKNVDGYFVRLEDMKEAKRLWDRAYAASYSPSHFHILTGGLIPVLGYIARVERGEKGDGKLETYMGKLESGEQIMGIRVMEPNRIREVFNEKTMAENTLVTFLDAAELEKMEMNMHGVVTKGSGEIEKGATIRMLGTVPFRQKKRVINLESALAINHIEWSKGLAVEYVPKRQKIDEMPT